MTSPTQRSLKYLRDRGYTAEVVEKYNSFVRRRFDLFGFIDILAIRGEDTVAIQTTTASNMAARLTKIRESEHLATVLGAGWNIEVHGWKKKAARWEVRVEEVRL